MSNFTVRLEPELAIILVEHRGSWDLQKSNEVMELVIRKARQSNADKVLFDHRHLRINLSTTEIFERGKNLLFSQAINYINKVAIVYSSGEENVTDGYRFFEAVLSNRGMNIRIFPDDIDRARAWLAETGA